MNNKSNSMILWVIALPLLLFTAFRSIHLIQSTLPVDAQIVAYAALAGLDGGLLAWLFFATGGARGNQRTIAYLMICLDMAGVMAATIGDTIMMVDPQGSEGFIATVAMWIVPIIITLNVLGTVASHLVDPAQQIKNKEREVRDQLDYSLAQQLADNASTIASGVVPQAAAHRMRQMQDQFILSATQGNTGNSFASIFSGNGNHKASTGKRFDAEGPSERALRIMSNSDPDDFTDEEADALNVAIEHVNKKLATGDEMSKADWQIREIDLATPFGGTAEVDAATAAPSKRRKRS